MENEPANLIREIETAFAEVQRGDGITLREARVLDNYGSDKERLEARKTDTDLCWQDVSDKAIEEYAEVLPFLDEESFRYYAPAYMIWALKHFKSSISLSSDAIIYAFDLPEVPDMRSVSLNRFAKFSPMQKDVIRRFLEFMALKSDGFADEVVASQALEKYWRKVE